VAVLLSGPSQPPSDTVGIVYAGPGSSDLDAVPPERDSDPDPIAAATEGPEGGCPEIAAEPPHTLDAAATGAGPPEDERDDERGENEVEAPPRRTLTDDDLQDAAAALIRFRDQGRAEVDLNLQSGELDGIIHSPAFVELVARKWLSGSYGYDLPIDFGAHLQPLQRRAAEFLSAGGTKQDAAAAVGRHRDTIHAWEQQPIFRACVRQSEIRSRQERARQRTARHEAVQDQVLGLFEEAVEVLRSTARTNPKVAIGTFTLLYERMLES